MGDEVNFAPNLQLRIAAPATGFIRLFRNGVIVHEAKRDTLDFAVAEPGTYRAEVWLELDGEWRPWIYANALRITKAAP